MLEKPRLHKIIVKVVMDKVYDADFVIPDKDLNQSAIVCPLNRLRWHAYNY